MSTRALRRMRPGAQDLSPVSGRSFGADPVSGGDAGFRLRRGALPRQGRSRDPGHPAWPSSALAVTAGVITSSAIVLAAVFAVLRGAGTEHPHRARDHHPVRGPAARLSGPHGPRGCSPALAGWLAAGADRDGLADELAARGRVGVTAVQQFGVWALGLYGSKALAAA